MSDMARIEITLRSDGRIDLRSIFMGRQDAAYLPLTHARLPAEVDKLARELRQQMAAELRGQLAACETAITRG